MADTLADRVLKKGVCIGRSRKQYKAGTKLSDIPEDIRELYTDDKLKKMSEVPPKPKGNAKAKTAPASSAHSSGSSPDKDAPK